MKPTKRTVARPKPVAEYLTKIVHRKLPLKIYELEPESGEDENLSIDLDLDQLED